MIGRTRWRFRSVESTQNVAFQLAAAGADHGTVVRADYQTAGRGRLGRTWEAPVGTALTFSVMLRPACSPHEIGTLSVRVADVLCTVFATLGVHEISLKWPNDVLISGRKVSGILVQTRMMPELVAVIGIGINISASPESATNLMLATGNQIDADRVFNHALTGLDQMWSGWQPELSESVMQEIDQRLWLRGEQVTLQDAEREITGTIAGVSPGGALRLTNNETERLIHVGEITRGPRPIHPD